MKGLSWLVCLWWYSLLYQERHSNKQRMPGCRSRELRSGLKKQSKQKVWLGCKVSKPAPVELQSIPSQILTLAGPPTMETHQPTGIFYILKHNILFIFVTMPDFLLWSNTFNSIMYFMVIDGISLSSKHCFTWHQIQQSHLYVSEVGHRM